MTILPSDFWLVLPAYNEAKYLRSTLTKVSKYTSRIIVIDDGSDDSTAAIARDFTPHVLQHVVNIGKGAALLTGCEYAFNTLNAKVVILIDGDDQHDPSELPLFCEALKSHDMVFGARSFKGMPQIRIFGNKLISLYVAKLFGVYIPDILSGYKAFTRKAFEKIAWQSSGYSVELEIAIRVARSKQSFSVVPIRTIYHDLDRGMTVLDALSIITQALSWKLQL